MRILYLSADRGIPIRGHKGAAVHVRMMCRAFNAMGHQVTILTPRPGPENGPDIGAQLIQVPMNRAAEYDDGELYAAAAIQLAQGSYDLVYERFSLWSSVGAQLRRAFDIPFVLEVNAPLRLEAAQYRSISDPELARLVERRQFGAADLIAAVSKPVADYVQANGAAADRVIVTPNGVDPDMFHPAGRGGPIHARYGLEDKYIIGFAGRIRPWHDMPTLLRAFSDLHRRDARCHLLLVGQYPDDLPAQIATMGLRRAVTLTGPIDHSEMPAHLAAMHVAVSPYDQIEAFYFSPMKLFEYLACAVPTVAARIGQIADVIEPGVNGLLYSPGNAAELAAAITRFQENDEWARRLAWQGAVQILSRHTWRHNAEAVFSGVNLPVTASDAAVRPLLDDNLRQRLYRATSPQLATSHFKHVLPLYGHNGPQRLKRISQIEVLKYKPTRRCVLRYELKGRDKATGQRRLERVIGKVFKDRRGRRLHAWQKHLCANGFGPDAVDHVYLPQSLAFIPAMRMQVQANAPGQTLETLLQRNKTVTCMPRIGQALAKLHGSLPLLARAELPYLKSYGLADELRNLSEIRAHLVEWRPEQAPAVEEAYRFLTCQANVLPPAGPTALLHRDFYYSQVLLWKNEVTIIDIDLLAEGDPAIDVANFSAHMDYLGLEQQYDFGAYAAERRRFTEAYEAATTVNATFWQRVLFYEKATLFRLLRVVANRPEKTHLFDMLLPHVLPESILEVV